VSVSNKVDILSLSLKNFMKQMFFRVGAKTQNVYNGHIYDIPKNHRPTGSSSGVRFEKPKKGPF